MKKKALLPIILGGVLLLAGCYQYYIPWPIYDTNTEDYIWDGKTADTEWFNENPNAASYNLSTPEEFAGLASLVKDGNGFAGKEIRLTNDIDLGNHNWTPIGVGNRKTIQNTDNTGSFQGTFDGGNHTISGLFINQDGNGIDDNSSYGFIGTAEGATIKNVKFENATVIANTACAGAAIGYAQNSQLENIIVSNSTIECAEGAGTITGRFYITEDGRYEIKNCQSIGNEVRTTSSYNAGGIVGAVSNETDGVTAYFNFDGNVVDMSEKGYVHSYSYIVGGMIGNVTTETYGTFTNNTIKLNEPFNQILLDYPGSDNGYYKGFILAHGGKQFFDENDNNIANINGNEIKLIADFNTWAYKGNNWLYGSHGVNKKPLEDTYGEEQNP